VRDETKRGGRGGKGLLRLQEGRGQGKDEGRRVQEGYWSR
jgi:hypothetical protein